MIEKNGARRVWDGQQESQTPLMVWLPEGRPKCAALNPPHLSSVSTLT